MSSKDYKIYFAWVSQEDRQFDPHFARFDEDLFNLEITHEEGQIPTASVEIKNPRTGLLNPTRAHWCWISFSINGYGPNPLFFGRLVGVPTELINNTIKMQLIARDSDYIRQKQLAAETLKIYPNYDPVFFEVSKRDDPDAILEGWSALYHVERTSGEVSASDILIGEDGTVVFASEDTFYNSVQTKVGQSPLVAVNVKAEVTWEQQWSDYFYLGHWAYPTLGGEPFVSDWPKTGAALGGGWNAGPAIAGERDPLGREALATLMPGKTSYSYSFKNTEKHHTTGDVMSLSLNWSTSNLGNSVMLKIDQQNGYIDEFAVDDDGEPAPVNIPASQRIEYLEYRTFALDYAGKEAVAGLGVVYHANRKRTERVEITVTSDVQPILIDPQVTEDTEQITLKSGDLALPLIELLNWDSVGDGTFVELGQMVFPNNPLVPGQTSIQICVRAGNTGPQEPIFSNVAGQTTTDGTVIWSSLGDTPPTETAQDWVRYAPVALGTLLLPRPIIGAPDHDSYLQMSRISDPPIGIPVAQYTVLSVGTAGSGTPMMECTKAGFVGGSGPQAVFQNFTNPTGRELFLCTSAGQTGQYHPSFSGAEVGDGAVVWTNIGPVNLPIGGWAGATPAAFYFPQDRGNTSLEHMIARARAKLRKRARAVQISFDTRFEVAAMLSCRMNGQVTDPRLPGGTVLGKVIAYKITATGETGELKGNVTLGCSIGKGSLTEPPPVLTETGTASYVEEGYVTSGYQDYYQTSLSSGGTSSVLTLPTKGAAFAPPGGSNYPPTLPVPGSPTGASYWQPGPTEPLGETIGYGPPTPATVDDGIYFPASKNSLILKNDWHGQPSTTNLDNIAAYNAIIHETVAAAVAAAHPSQAILGGGLFTATVPDYGAVALAVTLALDKALLQGANLWYELVLKPITNGPFTGSYVISTTPLVIPQTIDLSAPSFGG